MKYLTVSKGDEVVVGPGWQIDDLDIKDGALVIIRSKSVVILAAGEWTYAEAEEES